MKSKVLSCILMLSLTISLQYCGMSHSSNGSGEGLYFLSHEVKLETIRFRVLYQKIKTHFMLNDASDSLTFLNSQKHIWQNDKRINESKYKLLLDLADRVCSEIDFTVVGLEDAYNTQELFYKLTGLSQSESMQTALNIALQQSQASSNIEKQELACMMLILDSRIWLKI
ncbi:MAG TPA: hypothetical protein PKC21_08500 [Oligoflexia bacterium]|nr:hypothetical protein [Oligoflexia bacterium]HMR25379.1 hypothetical protein [Oligoflexia bacterium]